MVSLPPANFQRNNYAPSNQAVGRQPKLHTTLSPKFGSGSSQEPGFFTQIGNGILSIFGYKPKRSVTQTLIAPMQRDLSVAVLSEEQSKDITKFFKDTLNRTLTNEESEHLANFGSDTLIRIGNKVLVPETSQHAANWLADTANQVKTQVFNPKSSRELANWFADTANQAQIRVFTPKSSKDLSTWLANTANQARTQVFTPESAKNMADWSSAVAKDTVFNHSNDSVRYLRSKAFQNATPLKQMGYGAGMAASGHYILPYFTTPDKSNAVTLSGLGLMGYGTYSLFNKLSQYHERDQEQIDALSKAAKTGNMKALKQLVSDKVWTNGLDDEGCSALYQAAKHGKSDAVQFLIDNGYANIELGQPELQRTPLWIATQKGHTEIVNMLLENGANVHTADREGVTPAQNARTLANKPILNALIANKTEIISSPVLEGPLVENISFDMDTVPRISTPLPSPLVENISHDADTIQAIIRANQQHWKNTRYYKGY